MSDLGASRAWPSTSRHTTSLGSAVKPLLELGSAHPALPGAADGDPRHLCRERGAARPDEGPGDRPFGAELDDHELFADVRKPASAGRARRRPDRPSARIPHRLGGIHGRLARFGAGGQRRRAVRRSSRTGARRRAPLSLRSVDHHLAVQGPRARSRTGRLGRRRRSRRGDRRAAGRSAHAADRLARDLLHQPADRADRRGRRGPSDPSRYHPGGLAAARSARRAARDGERRRTGVRVLAGADRGLGLEPNRRTDHRRTRRAGVIRAR